mgnify:FL=1
MNKTIKNIFEKAGGSVQIEDVTQDEWTYTDNLDVEKFAEIVARQCIFELVHESTLYSDPNGNIQDLVVDVTNRIKKRFGIV